MVLSSKENHRCSCFSDGRLERGDKPDAPREQVYVGVMGQRVEGGRGVIGAEG